MKIKNIIILQLIVIIYTLNGIIAKFSAGQEVLSFGWLCFFAGEVAVLGIYAILWQQIIKRFELSVAYANRAMAIMWSALWATIIFHEKLKINNIIGILLVLAGTIFVNVKGGDDRGEELTNKNSERNGD